LGFFKMLRREEAGDLAGASAADGALSYPTKRMFGTPNASMPGAGTHSSSMLGGGNLLLLSAAISKVTRDSHMRGVAEWWWVF